MVAFIGSLTLDVRLTVKLVPVVGEYVKPLPDPEPPTTLHDCDVTPDDGRPDIVYVAEQDAPITSGPLIL